MIQKRNSRNNYSKRRPEAMYNQIQRQQKAKKILAVLSDFFRTRLDRLSVLDIGCSTGIMANFIAQHFNMIVGADIDTPAVTFANKNRQPDNAFFLACDALNIPFGTGTFDIIICAHVYEHVSNSEKLISEIHRVMKTGGICFFSAGNRIRLIEPHYGLPLLSVVPRCLANVYLKCLGKSTYYYENHLHYWGLRRLVSKFRLIDYTLKIIKDPEKFAATDVCISGSLKQKLAIMISKAAYWLVPTYVFLLQKR